MNNLNTILIIFTDPQLSYSPSTLNLYDALSQNFKVEIVSFEPDQSFSAHKITDRQVRYLNIPKQNPGVPLVKRIHIELNKTFFKNKVQSDLLNQKAVALIEVIENFNGEIIAIDFFALWCVQKAGKKAHLFSLELLDYDPYRNECNKEAIESVIIQTKDRYQFLFGDRKLKTFLVQNAPYYKKLDYEIGDRKKTNLVFCGSAVPAFGIFNCIEFITDFPEYTLTVKGAIPPYVKKVICETFDDLLEEKRLILDDEYISTEDLNDYLKYYYIGFVFYDFYRFEHINRFNYKTAPSGKLFQYYNSGLPVIANNLPGLNSIEDFAAGVMIGAMSSKSIKNAIDKIESNYESYVKGAKEAALHFDFRANIHPFIEYLTERSARAAIVS